MIHILPIKVAETSWSFCSNNIQENILEPTVALGCGCSYRSKNILWILLLQKLQDVCAKNHLPLGVSKSLKLLIHETYAHTLCFYLQIHNKHTESDATPNNDCNIKFTSVFTYKYLEQCYFQCKQLQINSATKTKSTSCTSINAIAFTDNKSHVKSFKDSIIWSGFQFLSNC